MSQLGGLGEYPSHNWAGGVNTRLATRRVGWIHVSQLGRCSGWVNTMRLTTGRVLQVGWIQGSQTGATRGSSIGSGQRVPLRQSPRPQGLDPDLYWTWDEGWDVTRTGDIPSAFGGQGHDLSPDPDSGSRTLYQCKGGPGEFWSPDFGEAGRLRAWNTSRIEHR